MSERFLVVSLGSIGRRHLVNLRKIRPDAKIGVLRLQASRHATEKPEEADVQFFGIEEALDFSPKAAIIASPAPTHLSVALPLTQAGVSLLVEKPFADCCEGLEDLIRESGNRETILMVGYTLRFLPSLAAARQLLRQGRIGQVLGARAEVGQYLPSWRPASPYQQTVSARRALGGGALLELSHELDYLYWMFGGPDRVSASGGRISDLDIDVEDMVSLSLEYDRPRRLVEVHLDFLQQPATRSCKFIGTGGTLLWDGIADRVDLFDASRGIWERIDTPPCPDRNEMYIAELTHFLECVETGALPAIDAASAYDVLAIVEAAHASMASKQAITVRSRA